MYLNLSIALTSTTKPAVGGNLETIYIAYAGGGTAGGRREI